ncbi:MAG: oligosaccharide flippase family protein [Rhizobacter sp.]|nr:oligosaccharide flippase family protein [Rhizobacter sp.]
MGAAAAPRLRHALPAVYAAAAVRLLLPVLVLPLMATRLGAAEFGRLSFVLVWSSLLAMVVEGGFLAAATRLAVTADAPRRWQIAQQVFSARCLLCVPAALLAVVAVRVAGQGSTAWTDTLAIAALACVLGWPATWYLQATQQLAAWAKVELVVYGLLIAACWAFAYRAETYLLLQTAASGVLAWAGWRWLRRDLRGEGRHLWSRPALAPGLRLGWTMMPVSIAGAAYSFALPAAASLQMGKAELGTYFMADRLVRAVLNAAEPVFAVVYPRIVTLFQRGARAALAYAVRWSVAGVLVGLALLAAGAVGWQGLEPLVVRRAAGLDLSLLRSTIMVLGWLLPLLLGWKFIGYWMLGSGRFDQAYRACVVVGGIAGTVGAATWGGAAGPVGLAFVAIGVEVLVIGVAVGGMLLTRRARKA